jgi:hypothetical protein
MLLATGNIPFEAFISADNDRRAVPSYVGQAGGGIIPIYLVAYPIIFIKIYTNGSVTNIPLRIENKVMEINTNAFETIIRGANRYYVPQVGNIHDASVYLTPASGYGFPTIKIYKLE